MLTLEEYRERKRLEQEIYNELNEVLGTAANAGMSTARAIGPAVSTVGQGARALGSGIKNLASKGWDATVGEFGRAKTSTYNKPMPGFAKSNIPSLDKYAGILSHMKTSGEQLSKDIIDFYALLNKGQRNLRKVPTNQQVNQTNQLTNQPQQKI